jgi:hydrogenase maturation factor
MAQIPSVVDKYIESLKQRQISDYALVELADIIDAIYVLHENNGDKADKRKLENVYSRLVTYYNNKVGKKIFNNTL